MRLRHCLNEAELIRIALKATVTADVLFLRKTKDQGICMTISAIKRVWQAQPELELAMLVGSQADGYADSDWNIAI